MIKSVIRRLVFGNKADSKAYIKYLRGLGMKIGEETTIYVPTKTQIDTTAIGGLHQTVLRSKTDAMRSERTKLIQL